MECPENGKVVCPVFGGIKCPAVSRSKFVFYTCRPDAYTINIAPDGSVLSENPKDGNLRCTDMLTRSVVHDGIFYVEESCRDLTQRPVRVDEKCLWREFSVFPYDGINTPDTVSQQYPELTKLCLRYFAQDKNTDSFRKQQAVPRFFSFRRFILENLRFLYRRPF